MSEEEKQAQETGSAATVWYNHQLLFFICGSIVIAFMLVLVSMALYASSGAAQLDLSRPGFKSVQGQLNQSDSFVSFPADGPVTAETLDEFLQLYNKQVRPVENPNVFSPGALSEQVLGIDSPTGS